MFITQEDYIQISADALNILKQCNENNRIKAETRAMEEISSYIADKYDMTALYGSVIIPTYGLRSEEGTIRKSY